MKNCVIYLSIMNFDTGHVHPIIYIIAGHTGSILAKYFEESMFHN